MNNVEQFLYRATQRFSNLSKSHNAFTVIRMSTIQHWGIVSRYIYFRAVVNSIRQSAYLNVAVLQSSTKDCDESHRERGTTSAKKLSRQPRASLPCIVNAAQSYLPLAYPQGLRGNCAPTSTKAVHRIRVKPVRKFRWWKQTHDAQTIE